MTNDLYISLEPHLIEALHALVPIVSTDLASSLSPYISSEIPPPSIPYSLLLAVSRWTRESGQDALRQHSPPLDPHAYTMLSLLAGSTTSPEKRFGPWSPPKDPAQVAAEKYNERKAIMAVMNALLSVLGSGFAAWWAADKTGWQNEWKVLFGLLVAIVVAATEGALYTIWQSRSSVTTKLPRRMCSARHKKDEEPVYGPPDTTDKVVATTTATNDVGDGLRHRH